MVCSINEQSIGILMNSELLCQLYLLACFCFLILVQVWNNGIFLASNHFNVLQRGFSWARVDL